MAGVHLVRRHINVWGVYRAMRNMLHVRGISCHEACYVCMCVCVCVGGSIACHQACYVQGVYLVMRHVMYREYIL